MLSASSWPELPIVIPGDLCYVIGQAHALEIHNTVAPWDVARMKKRVRQVVL